MFLQLSGNTSQNDDQKKFVVPKPNPKTLLDVMVGLNAFSHLPSPQQSTEPGDSFRGDSRMSFDQDSIYGSHENIARKFMLQWKNRVATRKISIMNKLDSNMPPPEILYQRSESINLSSVPEDPPASSHMKRRKSRWSVRQGLKQQPTLPSIDDEDERKHQFLAWVQDEKQKMRNEKSSLFANISPFDKQAQRRKSFTCWLQKRQEQMKADDSDDDLEALKDVSDEEVDDAPATIGDLMRTILKIKTRFKEPLDSRVKKFNNELEQIKKRDDEARNRPLSRSQKRRWKMLMRGIDAALADSSDEDDNYYHTV